MTRIALPLQVDDLSDLARNLRRQLAESPGCQTCEPPSHLALMNMLARAAGFQNHQHLRASALAAARLADPPQPPADHAKVAALLHHFDTAGRLIRWPARTAVQRLCVWALWSRLPAETVMTERDISARLNAWHLFGDAAILRRTMVELDLVTRTTDSSAYQRRERRPDPDVTALIRHLHSRSANAASA